MRVQSHARSSARSGLVACRRLSELLGPRARAVPGYNCRQSSGGCRHAMPGLPAHVADASSGVDADLCSRAETQLAFLPRLRLLTFRCQPFGLHGRLHLQERRHRFLKFHRQVGQEGFSFRHPRPPPSVRSSCPVKSARFVPRHLSLARSHPTKTAELVQRQRCAILRAW